MPGEFNSMGIVFQYPDNWTVDEEDAVAGDRSVTVYSPGGGFWSISVDPHLSDPIALANEALQAMKEEYDNLDVEEVRETLAGRELVGYDLNFFCMDLTSTAMIRCLRTDQGTYSVFCQAEDGEFENIGRVFQAMTVSLLRNLKRLRSCD